MSGKSYTSGSVRSAGGGGSVRLGGGGSVRLGATTNSSHEVVLDALYDRKRDKKTVRVLTVIIYVFCVSLAAIMLSLYYVFFWEPKDAHYAQRQVSHTVDQQTSTTPMPTCFMPYTGRSDTTVSQSPSDPPSSPEELTVTNATETSSPASTGDSDPPDYHATLDVTDEHNATNIT